VVRDFLVLTFSLKSDIIHEECNASLFEMHGSYEFQLDLGSFSNFVIHINVDFLVSRVPDYNA